MLPIVCTRIGIGTKDLYGIIETIIVVAAMRVVQDHLQFAGGGEKNGKREISNILKHKLLDNL